MLTKKVIFTSWQDGLKTISLAKYVHSETNLDFSKAKRVVDDLLDDKKPYVLIMSDKVDEFVETCSIFGAKAEVIEK